MEHLAVFSLPSPLYFFPLFIGVIGACLCRAVGAHGWFVRLPAIGAVFILELAASSGTSRMAQALNLRLATHLLIIIKMSI